MTDDTKVAVNQDFSYDPFDAEVMADPLPYYRTLRDRVPRVLHAAVGYVRVLPL